MAKRQDKYIREFLDYIESYEDMVALYSDDDDIVGYDDEEVKTIRFRGFHEPVKGKGWQSIYANYSQLCQSEAGRALLNERRHMPPLAWA